LAQSRSKFMRMWATASGFSYAPIDEQCTTENGEAQNVRVDSLGNSAVLIALTVL